MADQERPLGGWKLRDGRPQVGALRLPQRLGFGVRRTVVAYALGARDVAQQALVAPAVELGAVEVADEAVGASVQPRLRAAIGRARTQVPGAVCQHVLHEAVAAIVGVLRPAAPSGSMAIRQVEQEAPVRAAN
jgi:hypothetical protein